MPFQFLKGCKVPIQYDIAVAYRIYPRISKNPLIFNDNKYKLSELCLKSFKDSLGTLKSKLWVLLDNCPQEYEGLFEKYFAREDLELVKLDGTGNLATFNMQVDILSEQDISEVVYFSEDDYFYLPNQFEHMVKFLQANDDVAFVSPYDHPDYYTSDLHRHQNMIRVFGDRHWRTANSTCLTFLTTKATLKKTKSIFKTYTKRNADASLWLSLTKHKLFNPFLIFKYLVKDWLLFKIIVKSWLYGWKHNLFGKKRHLWVPIPAIATHMEKACLSPSIDWLALVDRQIRQMTI